MTGAQTVIALRALGLGDLCSGIPALRALRRGFPDHRLVLAAPAWQEPIARGAGVDAVVDTGELTPIDPSLHGADVAVNLHGRGPRSTELLAASRPARLVAFRHPDLRRPPEVPVRWRRGEHEVHRWCRLLTESGVPADPAQLHLPPPGVESPAPGATVVHPGAAAAARRWPASRFATVVAELLDRGEHVVLTGSSEEQARCRFIAETACRARAGAVTVLAGETDLLQLAALVAHARLLVCNDTGVAHLATAYGTPSVVLFGPTSPAEWGPPPGRAHTSLWAGRHGDPHGDRLDPGLACIQVDDVLSAIEGVVRDVAA